MHKYQDGVLEHQLRVQAQSAGEQPGAAWGFYLKAAVADGNPNYIKHSLIAGIGGKALFFGRPQDNFGIGAFYYDLSDVLQDALNPALTNFQDESAIKVYYSWAVRPWLRLGTNIQYINPARGDYENALVPSLRMQIQF